MTEVSFGVRVPNSGPLASVENIVRAATEAEALTTMAYLAAVTRRVQIGVACLVMPTRNPIYAAKQLATLDHLSGGRVLAGVGLGSKATFESDEFEVFGVPFSKR